MLPIELCPVSLLPEIRQKIEVIEECWIWNGPLNESGYGYVAGNGVIGSVHRFMYVALREQIPQGFELDHHCRNPRCCNPAHLEPVTPEENYRRRQVSPRIPVETCKRGHEFTGVRTRLIGGRYCKVCININRNSLREKLK